MKKKVHQQPALAFIITGPGSVAAPSQQRCAQHQLRRSSAARSISSVAAASARRDAQNERDGAGLRISVAAATPSQLRRSSAARTMSGRRGIGRSSPSGKFAAFWAKTGVPTTLLLNTLFSLKSLGHSPAPGIFFFWVILKRAVFGYVVTHRIFECVWSYNVKFWHLILDFGKFWHLILDFGDSTPNADA